MLLATIDAKGGKGRGVDIADAMVCAPFNEGLVHQIVVSEMAAARSGSKANRNRSAVRGGGSKPWRQKGTGRARAGTSSSPLWRGGGVAFAARPRDFGQKINRKMFRQSLRVVLSDLVRSERLKVIDDLGIETAKTRDLIAILRQLGVVEQRVLVVVGGWNENLLIAARNIHWLAVVQPSALNSALLVSHACVVITVDALKSLEHRLS